MKKSTVILCTLMVILLTGCAQLDARLEDAIRNNSNIFNHEDYLTYQDLSKTDMLDKEGKYLLPDMTEIQDGTVKVSFGENRYIKISYFLDPEMTVSVTDNYCYVNPGDSIYAKIATIENPYTDTYTLSGFRLLDYEQEGKINSVQEVMLNDDGMVCLVPNDYQGGGYSIIPIGKFPDKTLQLVAYEEDKTGKRTAIAAGGKWVIISDDKEKECSGTVVDVGATETYIMKFDFDEKNYFFVDSIPKAFTKNPSEIGYVEFSEVLPTETENEYKVELHKYLELVLQSNAKATVKVNEGNATEYKKNQKIELTGLKFGDKIEIETTKECAIINGDYQYVSASKDELGTKNRYTILIKRECDDNEAEELLKTLDVDRSFDIELSEESKYGECTYLVDGKTVSGSVSLEEGTKITIKYKITEKGYIFADKDDGLVQKIFNKKQRSVDVVVTSEMDGNVIHPDNYFTIKKED